MIDISNARCDFSKSEEGAIKWLNEHDFDGKLVKQYVSKTKFILSKDGVEDTFELPQGIVFKDINAYMEQFSRNWDMICELHRRAAAETEQV